MSTELTTFTPEITEESLRLIKEQARNLPEVITNKKEYDDVYEAYQEIKKLRIKVDKKEKELIKFEKIKFDKKKDGIQDARTNILNMLVPLEQNLLSTRKVWEDKKTEEKKAEAYIEATKQKAEFDRRELIQKHTQALIDNENYNEMKSIVIEARRLAIESDKLSADKLAFEIEKDHFQGYIDNQEFDKAKKEEEARKLLMEKPEISKEDLDAAYEWEEKRNDFIGMKPTEQIDAILEETNRDPLSPTVKEGSKKSVFHNTITVDSIPDELNVEEVDALLGGVGIPNEEMLRTSRILCASENFRDFIVNELYEGFQDPKTADKTADLKDCLINYINFMEDKK